jgi:hypothetical protein
MVGEGIGTGVGWKEDATKVGALELLQNLEQADELSLGRPFQDPECTRWIR